MNNYLDAVIDNITDDQIAKGLYASGKSINSLRKEVNSDGTGKLTGDESFYYQIHGRPPGKMPPIQKMIAWVAVRRIQISPWAIAKKIQREGTAIFRGERKGLDMKKALDDPKKQLYRDMAQAFKEEGQARIRQAIKTNK